MSKTLKMSILLMIITLSILFFAQIEVSAVMIDSAEALKEVFAGKDVTINGATITLNGDVEFKNSDWTEESEEPEYDIVELYGADYVIDLNGNSIKAQEFCISEGTVTINDSKGKGKIDAGIVLIEESANVVVNNGIFTNIVDNCGKLTINNGEFFSIWNSATLVIEDGSFINVLQEGNATIKGGTFTASRITFEDEFGQSGYNDFSTQFAIEAKTVITGGEFKTTNLDYALKITTMTENGVNEESINELIGDGYIVDYTMAPLTGAYDVSYNNVKIIKDVSAEILEKAAPNGVWEVNCAKPKDMPQAEALLTAVAGEIQVPEGFVLRAWCIGKEFDPEVGQLVVYTTGGKYLAEKNIKINYIQPSETVKNEVSSVVNKIDAYTQGEITEETAFRLEDLYLINYLNASSNGIEPSSALNFAKDLIKLTDGGNISYKFESKQGSFSPNGLWHYKGGQVTVYCNGKAVTTTKAGLTTNHILYVSVDTKDDDNSRITAALKRIEDYLGTTKGITIKVGGPLQDLNVQGYDWNEYGFIDEKTCGSNYYKLTINGKEYRFVICKKEVSKLETPKYVGNNLESNISITTEDTTIPLDTRIEVKEPNKEEKNTIQKALRTDEYVAYDISLYSNAKQKNITKLENNKFKVSIPVPESLKEKELIVYYIKNAEEKYEHEADVQNGIVTFETDHFSIYTLVEKKNEQQESYKVIFDANGGTFASGKNTFTIEKWEIGDEEKLESPTKEGYEFLGYYTKQTGGTPLLHYINEAGIDKDMTFYAQWKEVEKTDKIPDDNKQDTPSNDNTDTLTNNDKDMTSNTTNPSNNPTTGDNIILFVTILVIAVLGVFATIKFKKRIKNN